MLLQVRELAQPAWALHLLQSDLDLLLCWLPPGWESGEGIGLKRKQCPSAAVNCLLHLSPLSGCCQRAVMEAGFRIRIHPGGHQIRQVVAGAARNLAAHG